MAKWCLAPAVLLTIVIAGAAASADQIKLTDGTEVSGRVVQRDSDNIYLQLPRASVVSVNGQALPEPVTVGHPAPAFQAVDLAGTSQQAPLKGKATLLKFWASWCPHCRADVPLMKTLPAKYGERGFQLVTVSTDQDVEKLKTFLQTEQITYSVIAAFGSTPQPSVPELYEVQGIPAYFLIDANGVVVNKWSGSFVEAKVDLDAALAPLLASSTPASR